MSLYIVAMHHSDGTLTYAAKESWTYTKSPKAVFTLPSAQGKARWWMRVAKVKNNGVELESVDIKPVRLEVSAEVEESFYR